MVAIVVNRCYGGFGLSDKAIRLYAEKKGITLYSNEDGCLTHYYTVPVEEYEALSRDADLLRKEWGFGDERLRDVQLKINDIYFSDRRIDRDDSALVDVVRELGEDADGEFAELEIVEIPDDVDWFIDEYDGVETIRERHRSW